MVFFAQKTPDFGPKDRLRIWGVPPPPFTDKIPKEVFEGFPKFIVKKKKEFDLITLVLHCDSVLGHVHIDNWSGLYKEFP